MLLKQLWLCLTDMRPRWLLWHAAWKARKEAYDLKAEEAELLKQGIVAIMAEIHQQLEEQVVHEHIRRKLHLIADQLGNPFRDEFLKSIAERRAERDFPQE